MPVAPRWRGILHAGHEWYWNFRIEDNEVSKNTDFQLGLGAGYFIADNVALEGILYYQKEKRVFFLAGFQVYLNRNRSGKE